MDMEMVPPGFDKLPLRQFIYDLGVATECWNERDVPFNHQVCYNGWQKREWKDIKERFAKMKEYPPLSDRQFFPSSIQYVYTQLQYNDELYQAFARRKRICRPYEVIQYEMAMEYLMDVQSCWSLLLDAMKSDTGPSNNRDALYKLRERLGYEAYYSGRMPAAVPPEYMRRIP
jgi:hypothetical protein